jgi:mannose-6-phosphate isomerase-like protein (cupin superfamily)
MPNKALQQTANPLCGLPTADPGRYANLLNPVDPQIMEKKMEFQPINLQEKLAKFSDHWSPKIIAQMNDYHFKLVKFQGDFIWHRHDDTDEVFMVLDGKMSIDFKDGQVELKRGELFVVPKGIEHKPYAEKQCEIMLVEPAGTINTGDTGGDLTAEDNLWI